MSLQLVLLAGAAQAGPFEDMEALRRILISHRDAGYMIPVQMNMEKYLNRDVRTALDMARTMQGDDCTRAVRLALFLDAHTADMETLAGRVYGSGLLGDLDMIWYGKDENDLVGLFAEIFERWLPLFKASDTLRKIVLTHDALLTAGTKMAASNRDLWVQEIVEVALRSGWDAAMVARAKGQLDKKIDSSIAWINRAEQVAWAEAAAAETTYETATKAAATARENATDAVKLDLAQRRVTLSAANERIANIESAYKTALYQAQDRAVGGA